MLPGMNPKKMQKMMKQLGIQQTELQAEEVIIRTSDKELIFHQPGVAKVNMMGQETYQITGSPEVRERSSTPDISQEDIQTVMQQTGASKEKAQEAIEATNGDLAEAIMQLSQEK